MAQRPEQNLAAPFGGGAAGGRGGSGGGGGPTLASAGLDFDTTGLEKFTKALKDAATAAKALWTPFTDTSKQRATLTFLDTVKKEMKHIRGDAEAVGAVGVGVGAGGGPGGAPGTRKRSVLGGNYNMPVLPGSLTTGGQGAPGLIWNAKEMFQARKNGGDTSIPSMPRTGKWGTAAIAASVLGGKMGEAQRAHLPDDVDAQFATARAMMTGGTGGRKWSDAYLDDRTLAVQGERRGFSDRKDVTAAQMIGQQIGITAGAGGAAGRRGERWMESVGVVARATGLQGAQVARSAAGIQSAETSNTLLQYGVVTSPGGNVNRPITDIYKDMLPPVFGTTRPTQEQILAARLPGQPGPRRVLEHIFSNDAASIDAFLVWVEANAATGKTITSMAQAEQSPLARHTTAGQEQELLGGRGRRHAGEAEGRQDAYQVEMDARIKLNQIVEDQYDRFEKLGLWVGRLQGAFETLTRVMGPLTTLITGWVAGQAIKGAAGAAAGAAAATGAAAAALGAVGVGAAGLAGGVIGTGIRNINVGDRSVGERLEEEWAGPVGRMTGNQAAKATGAGQKRTHKGKQVYKGKTRYGVDMQEGAPTEYHDYGRGPFPELKPEADQGDPVGAWPWRFPTTGIGDPTPTPAASLAPNAAPPAGATKLRGGGRSEGMNADFLSRLQRMFADNPRLSLTSGFRTRAEQERLYREKPGLAAPPGRSNHEKGTAADIGPASEYDWLAQNAPKYGLRAPMPVKEKWHWEPGQVVGGSAPSLGAEDAGTPSGEQGVGAAGGSVVPWGPNLTPPGGLFGGGGGGGPSAAPMTLGKSAPVGTDPAAAAAFAGSGPGGAPANLEEVLRLAKSAGFSGMALQTIAAIAMGESKLNPRAMGDMNLQDAKWGPSVGLWQVRTLKAEKGKGTTRDIDALLADTGKQAKSAWEISQGGTNFKPWSVYTSGIYKQNMGAVQQIMSARGIGDPLGRPQEASPPPPMLVSSGMPIGQKGGGGGIVIHNLDLRVEIARGTPEEAERTGQMIADILSDRDRLLAVGDE